MTTFQDSSERDLALAQRIHYSMLPVPFANEELTVGLAYSPAASLGGDYCHVERLEGGRYFGSISDVSGHGLPAALMVGRVNSFVRASRRHYAHPGRLLQELNYFLCEHFSDLGLFLTVFAVFLDLPGHCLRACGAGHPPAFLLSKDKTVSRIWGSNPPLGISCSGAISLKETQHTLRPGDTLTLYTDGIYEVERDNEMLDLDYLEEILVENFDEPPQSQCEKVLRRSQEFHRGPLVDDALLLSIRLNQETKDHETNLVQSGE